MFKITKQKMRNPFKKEKSVTIEEIEALLDRKMDIIHTEICQVVLDQEEHSKKMEDERIEREIGLKSESILRDEKLDNNRVEYELYVNNSMREVSDHLVELLNKADEPIPRTNYKNPSFFWH